jgi:hypothetical protein
VVPITEIEKPLAHGRIVGQANFYRSTCRRRCMTREGV